MNEAGKEGRETVAPVLLLFRTVPDGVGCEIAVWLGKKTFGKREVRGCKGG